VSAAEAVYSRLSGYSGLTNLVSTRIYPTHLPQDVTLPAVTYTLISAGRESALSTDTGDVRARVRVTTWSDDPSPLEAMNVMDQVRAALKRFRGTAGTVTVKAIYMMNENAFYDFDTRTHYIASDFEINYMET
jgi:hypothetical protein